MNRNDIVKYRIEVYMVVKLYDIALFCFTLVMFTIGARDNDIK